MLLALRGGFLLKLFHFGFQVGIFCLQGLNLSFESMDTRLRSLVQLRGLVALLLLCIK